MFFVKKIDKKIDIEKIKEKIEVFETDIVDVGGSWIEGQINSNSLGMGNIYSDIDFFIIREHNKFINTDYIYNDKYKKTLFIKELKSDIEIFDNKFIKLLIKEINNINYNKNIRTENVIKLDISLLNVNEFLCRLYNSICLYNNKCYTELKKSINHRNFLELYKIDCLNSIDNEIEDVIGNIDEKQYDAALYCMRNIFINFSKYFIMKNNEYIDRDKWVFLKLFNIINKNYHYDIKEYYNKLFCSSLIDNKENIILESLNYIRQKIEILLMEDIDV